MTVGPVTNPTQQISTLQNQQFSKPVGQKNDGDGDEVNGVDPANEKAKEAAKISAQQNSSVGAGGVQPSNSALGGNVNQTA